MRKDRSYNLITLSIVDKGEEVEWTVRGMRILWKEKVDCSARVGFLSAAIFSFAKRRSTPEGGTQVRSRLIE